MGHSLCSIQNHCLTATFGGNRKDRGFSWTLQHKQYEGVRWKHRGEGQPMSFHKPFQEILVQYIWQRQIYRHSTVATGPRQGCVIVRLGDIRCDTFAPKGPLRPRYAEDSQLLISRKGLLPVDDIAGTFRLNMSFIGVFATRFVPVLLAVPSRNFSPGTFCKHVTPGLV